MACRPGCGACCIAISIKRPYYGMPEGKPAGVACVHLGVDQSCALFADARRPALCAAFAADPDYCGDSREQALARLAQLELMTMPVAVNG